MTHNLNQNLHNQKEKEKYYSNTNSIKVWNTNERDLTPKKWIRERIITRRPKSPKIRKTHA